MPPGEEEVALKEQLLKKCHITETNSPWNSLLFVIHRKASDTWRLLHDLRKIYEVIENLGLLLLGLTSLSMILTDLLVIIDLRLFVFSIFHFIQKKRHNLPFQFQDKNLYNDTTRWFYLGG